MEILWYFWQNFLRDVSLLLSRCGEGYPSPTFSITKVKRNGILDQNLLDTHLFGAKYTSNLIPLVLFLFVCF